MGVSGLTGQGNCHVSETAACYHPARGLLCGVVCRVFSFLFLAAFGDFFVDKTRLLF